MVLHVDSFCIFIYIVHQYTETVVIPHISLDDMMMCVKFRTKRVSRSGTYVVWELASL